MKIHKIDEQNFLKKGYLIKKTENKNALHYINHSIKKNLFKIIKIPKKNINNFSYNQLHNYLSLEELNDVRLKLIKSINSDKKFRVSYFELAKTQLKNIIGNELAMQKNINISIQLPQDESSLLPIHSDTWSGDSPFEAVLWVPMVNCFKTKSMFLFNQKQDKKLKKIFKMNKTKSTSELFEHFKKDLSFIKINYGNFLLFNQNLPHGNVVNRTNETRLSLNCRFKGLFTPYAQKKLGSFFSPLTITPASKIGLNYKFPGEE